MNQPLAKILIVENDQSFWQPLTEILSSLGSVTFAHSANQAADILIKDSFDLILSALNNRESPDFSLISYLSQIRSKIPILLVSPHASRETLLQAIQHHVLALIEDPTSQKETFIAQIQEGIRISQEEKRLTVLAELGMTASEIVHEISSPLTVLDILINDLDDSSVFADSKKMLRATERIKQIIASTKDSIRDTKSKSQLAVSLSDCLLEASNEISIRASQKKVQLEILNHCGAIVTGQKVKICQIVINLVNNAIDAAAELPEKWVRVETTSLESSAQILITDSGKGIPKLIQDQLYRTLFTTKGKNGNGLGLGIVKKLTESLGGKVELNTQHSNTQFIVTLPISNHK